MSQFPFLVRGKVGALEHYHLNELMESGSIDERQRAIEPKTENVDRLAGRGKRGNEPIVAQTTVTARFSGISEEFPRPPWAMAIRWQELGLFLFEEDTNQWRLDYDVALERDSGVGFAAGRWAHILRAPLGLIHGTTDNTGKQHYVYTPPMTVMLARVTGVNGLVNAVYDTLAVDGAIEQLASEPIDRWDGIDYEPKSEGDFVLIVAQDGPAYAPPSPAYCVAFETPVFAQCPPSPASVPIEQLIAV